MIVAGLLCQDLNPGLLLSLAVPWAVKAAWEFPLIGEEWRPEGIHELVQHSLVTLAGSSLPSGLTFS